MDRFQIYNSTYCSLTSFDSSIHIVVAAGAGMNGVIVCLIRLPSNLLKGDPKSRAIEAWVIRELAKFCFPSFSVALKERRVAVRNGGWQSDLGPMACSSLPSTLYWWTAWAHRQSVGWLPATHGCNPVYCSLHGTTDSSAVVRVVLL
jgi:hypothetical protein